jgi:hypothetical protein
MSTSELINEILSEWAYRVENGMPDTKNPIHLQELSNVLNEMGLSSVRNELLESLREAGKNFSNPVLNKEIPYKSADGTQKKGIVGNLLRLPKEHPGRVAAEKMLPPDPQGRKAAMKDLGSEKDGHSTTPKPKKDGEEQSKDREQGGAGNAEAEKQKATQAMFQDPTYVSARLDAEKDAAEKLAKSDADKGEDGGTFGTDEKDKAEKQKEETPGFKPVEPEEITKQMPEADTAVFNQDSDIEQISPQERHTISTKIDELAKLADEAKAKGEKAPNYNLCKVTVPGTNLYCDNNLGIPREQMPQFKGKPEAGSPADKMPKDKNGEVDTEEVFKKMLADRGIKTVDTEVPSDSLKASQSELVGAKVAGMTKALEEDPTNKGITAPIYVSRDGYVIDGHHRWAAVTSKAIKDGKPANMKVHVIDMDAKDIIPMANKFAEDIGVAAKKADANAETTPSHKDDEHQNKVIASRIQNKIKGWADEEKDFFKKKVYKGNSPERRSWGEAIKAKGIGAWHSILKGAKHEVEEFKTAGHAVKDLVSGKKLDNHQKKALKAVGIKIATTALFGGLTGGLEHGAAKFALHVAKELIPHTVAETIVKGVGKASLFAGAEEEDMYMEKFINAISEKIADMDITPEMLEQMVDTYNENKDSKTNEDISYMKDLITETVIELINELMDEAKGKAGESEKFPGFYHRGGGYYSSVDGGEITHKSEKGKKNLTPLGKAEKDKVNHKAGITPKKTQEPVAGADLYGKDYKDARGGGEAPKTTKKGKVVFDDRVDGEKALKLKETYNTDSKFSEPGMTHDERVAGLIKKKAHKIGDTKMEDVYSAMGLKEGQAKFPAKYISVLTNALNFGKGPYTITDLTDAAGAGTLDSTLGELVVLMGSTLKDETQRKQFFDFLREKIKAGGDKSPITMAWVNSGQDACDAWHRSLANYECPGGYETNGNFWDIPSEAKAAGIKNYKADKGKSTDVNTLVNCIGKDGNMTQKWLQPSLKKNKKVNAFNSTTGRVYATTVLRWAQGDEKAKYARYGAELDSYEGLDPLAQAGDRVVYNNDGSGTPKLDKNGNTIPLTIKLRKTILNKMMADIEKKYVEHIPEQADPQKAIARQSALHKKMLNDSKALAERDEFLTSYRSMKPVDKLKVCAMISKNMNQKGDKYTNELMDTLNNLAEYDTTTSENFVNALTEMGITNTKDTQKMMVAIMNGVINTKGTATTSAKFKTALTKNSHEHSKAVLEYLIHDTDNKKALLENISTAFPLKDLMEGKEWAILGEKGGGINLNKNTITKCLGATKFDEVVEKMVIVDFKGEPTLAYAADNGKRIVPIGVINCRPDGIMYGGTWKLELSIHEGFSDCCKLHDK